MALNVTSDAFLSVRSSCDRCHAQKLKCLLLEPPSETACCQRCARAMVPCSFSRRTRSKRAGTDSDQKRRRVEAVLDDQEMTAPKDSLAEQTDIFLFGGGHRFPMQDSHLGPKDILGIEGLEGANNSLLRYTFQHDTTMSNLQLFTHDMSLFRQSSGEATHEILHPSLSTSEASSSPHDSTGSGIHIMSPGLEQDAAKRMLMEFPSLLHEWLETLQKGSWKREETGLLDGYPIGSVLHMSQRLSCLSTALRKGTSGGEGESTSLPWFDSSVTLILLSCYITVLRIYTVVLGNFENHLSVQPVSSASVRALSMNLYPMICLGELPPVNSSHHSIHTAVCMLLDSLGQAEEALGLPPQAKYSSRLQPENSNSSEANASYDAMIAREETTGLAQCGLLASAAGMQEAPSALAKKVMDIKELLRQHMSL